MNIHPHKLNWHVLGLRLEHLLHDPRFWAAIALVVLFALMVITAIYAKPGQGSMTPLAPMYPYMP